MALPMIANVMRCTYVKNAFSKRWLTSTMELRTQNLLNDDGQHLTENFGLVVKDDYFGDAGIG